MKRLNNVWDTAVSIENGIRAVIEGTHKKRGDREVQKLLYTPEEIMQHPELWHCIDPEKARAYVMPICESLVNGTYHHDTPKYRHQLCQSSNGGKWRDLYIPNLKDHVVHHMIMQACMKAFTRGMHPHCCGSVPGRGIKHIVKTVPHWLATDKQCRCFVQLDIRKFFDHIPLDKMFDKLTEKIKDWRALFIWYMILTSAPICVPVGYYPSPWLSNLYLEDLDWFIEQDLYKERRGKRIKYVRHMLRYTDNILLLGSSKSDLEKAVRAIIRYLKEKKGLDIKTEWEIKTIGKHEVVDGKWKLKPGTYWIDIGGYKFCKDGMMLRDGVFLGLRRQAKRMHKLGYYTEHECLSINARVAWAEAVGSQHLLENDVLPYVNIKTTRRIISELDKERKWRAGKTGIRHYVRRQSNSEPELPEDPGNG